MSVHHLHGGELVRQVRISRQGIYDVDRTLVAYQVRFDADELDAPGGVERATSKVILSTLGTFGLDNISGGRPIFIEFTPAFLTGQIPIPLEPDRVMIAVPAGIEAEPALLDGLAALLDLGRAARTRLDIRIVGVTGSVGKTSTKD